MDKEMLEQFQLLHQSMVHMEQRMDHLAQEIKETKQEIKESETRTKVFIENKVTTRIDALIDGYQTVHEKQWVLEHRTEQLQSQINDLQIRMAALEEKTA